MVDQRLVGFVPLLLQHTGLRAERRSNDVETLREQCQIDSRVPIDSVRAEDPRLSRRNVSRNNDRYAGGLEVAGRGGVITVVGLCEARPTGGCVSLFFLQVNKRRLQTSMIFLREG